MSKLLSALLLLLSYSALFYLEVISLDVFMFLVFISFLVGTMYLDRKNMKRTGITFMRRTQNGKKLIDKVANTHRGFWNAVSYVGIGTGIIIMIVVVFMMVSGAFNIFTQESVIGSTAIVLPGIGETPIVAPGVILIPWWIWLVAIIIVVVPHEFMHGVMARLEKIKVKSVGWAFFLILPAAFVEPDERQFQRAKRFSRLKVYAAGSFANLTIAGFLLVVLTLTTFSFTPSGVPFTPINDTPVHMSNLSGAIISINGVTVSSPQDITNILVSKSPGDSILIKTKAVQDYPLISQSIPIILGNPLPIGSGVFVDGEEKETNVTLANRNGTSYLGVFTRPIEGDFSVVAYETPSFPIVFIYYMMFWFYFFSLGIGLFNLLPLKPLDGGPFFQELIGKYTPHAERITKYVSIIVFALLLFNIFGPYIV
jgi:membrane-associated protease RseP (regulator of RpoE activity)